MKKNRIILLVVLVLIVAAAVLVLTNSTSTLRKSESNFAIDDTSALTKIFIADKNNREIILSRDTSGTWLVNGNLAQPAKISSFLETLSELEVKYPVPLVARNNVITRMATLAKKVEVYQVKPLISIFGKVRLFSKERLVKTYYVGDVTADNQGTFMLMEGSEQPYVVHIPNFRGFISARYSALEYEWRDYTVFHAGIGEIKSVKVEFPAEPQQSFLLEVGEDRSVQLTSLPDSQPVQGFDTIRVLNFMTAFADIRFESLLNGQVDRQVIDSVTATRPSTLITLTTRKNITSHVKIFYKPGFGRLYKADGALLEPFDLDRAYALVNDDKDFVLIQYFVFDKVTRTLGYLQGVE
jgi:hypothetical protein